jgi:ArsR family transcriptional regulator
MPELAPLFTGQPIGRADAAHFAGVMKILADPARLQLLSLLAAGGDQTGLQLMRALGWLKQPTVSHHLQALAAAGFTTRYGDGPFRYNRLSPDGFAVVADALRPGGERQ